MLIEITGYSISQGVISIYGTDVSEAHLQYLERNRYDDRFEREFEFIFDTKKAKVQKSFYFWMKKQKAANGAKTWRDALQSVIGTRTYVSGRYLNRDWI